MKQVVQAQSALIGREKCSGRWSWGRRGELQLTSFKASAIGIESSAAVTSAAAATTSTTQTKGGCPASPPELAARTPSADPIACTSRGKLSANQHINGRAFPVVPGVCTIREFMVWCPLVRTANASVLPAVLNWGQDMGSRRKIAWHFSHPAHI